MLRTRLRMVARTLLENEIFLSSKKHRYVIQAWVGKSFVFKSAGDNVGPGKRMSRVSKLNEAHSHTQIYILCSLCTVGEIVYCIH